MFNFYPFFTLGVYSVLTLRRINQKHFHIWPPLTREVFNEYSETDRQKFQKESDIKVMNTAATFIVWN